VLEQLSKLSAGTDAETQCCNRAGTQMLKHRCWNTDAGTQMLKHSAETELEQMLKHSAVTELEHSAETELEHRC
jgi:hypothetical protein